MRSNIWKIIYVHLTLVSALVLWGASGVARAEGAEYTDVEWMFDIAEGVVSLGDHIVVVSADDFHRELGNGSAVRVSDTALAEAVEVAKIVNDPAVVGLVATVERADTYFQGSLFAVVYDPMFDQTGALIAGRTVELMAVELSGNAVWWGKAEGSPHYDCLISS